MCQNMYIMYFAIVGVFLDILRTTLKLVYLFHHFSNHKRATLKLQYFK